MITNFYRMTSQVGMFRVIYNAAHGCNEKHFRGLVCNFFF